MNHYKDQEEDLEKYKLICRFVNPEAAEKIWGEKDPETTGETPEDELIAAMAEQRGIDPKEMRERLANPEKYNQDGDLDKIEAV